MERYICPECGTEMDLQKYDEHTWRPFKGREYLLCPKCNFIIHKVHYDFIRNIDTSDKAKPPLGCAPSHVYISARICDLCEAIKRYSTENGKHNKISLWCKEILMLNEMDRNLRYEEKCKVWKEDKDGHLQEVP